MLVNKGLKPQVLSASRERAKGLTCSEWSEVGKVGSVAKAPKDDSGRLVFCAFLRFDGLGPHDLASGRPVFGLFRDFL